MVLWCGTIGVGVVARIGCRACHAGRLVLVGDFELVNLVLVFTFTVVICLVLHSNGLQVCCVFWFSLWLVVVLILCWLLDFIVGYLLVPVVCLAVCCAIWCCFRLRLCLFVCVGLLWWFGLFLWRCAI